MEASKLFISIISAIGFSYQTIRNSDIKAGDYTFLRPEKKYNYPKVKG